MFIKFKISNRPIAPHLLVYTPQLSSLFSIWHRISGVGLAFFFTTFLIFIRIILSSNFACNLLTLISFEISQWIIIYFNLFILLFLFYHLFNGTRHIIWDFGFLLDIKYLSKFSLFLLVSLSLILIFQ
uniref:Succinate dehydrogenase cytochrome b560 subunit n=1 Tax=Chondrus crispus TaxID=2769 RepID=C560_CHOCR|nr:succinate:cytochrome c oxidoreductase subunit 3 [Chondrus crispus]P48934.1 RecName: Full=Succinate dehydrogenase cytochrome b560 subunit; AltName: Full=Succinate dehydrogenase, subunit III [Chondrus crispus]CAA87612.1 succinate dehydrogenase, subunit III [Chondrus crispus]